MLPCVSVAQKITTVSIAITVLDMMAIPASSKRILLRELREISCCMQEDLNNDNP